jgi:cytidyltransferase-like protein
MKYMSILKTAGIIAEFNPFHNGHARLIKKAREAGCSRIVVVMSGNYTQRGEGACMFKDARARMALSCGADLVLELPLPWAVSGAEKFAFGAVSLLTALNCVDSICFGSECGDMARLRECANRLLELDGSAELAAELRQGYSFPKARSLALGGDMADILRNPNDTLAVEYLKALQKLGSPIQPFAIKREGARHDGSPSVSETGTMTAPASSIRSFINSQTPRDAEIYMPRAAAGICAKELGELRAPYLASRAEPLILSQLRRMNADEIKRLPDVSEGLENRIVSASRSACSIDGLYGAIKSKRYPLARIRRIVLCAFLGIDRSYTVSPPSYLRVLGFNANGQSILRDAKKHATLPVVTRHADFARLNAASQRIYALECRSTDLYGICLPRILPCGLEQKFKTLSL